MALIDFIVVFKGLDSRDSEILGFHRLKVSWLLVMLLWVFFLFVIFRNYALFIRRFATR